MLFPVRDSIPSRRYPAVSTAVIVVCALVFVGFFITMAELPAIVFLGFWFILQFFQGTLSLAATAQAGGVAWFAHIGGFVFGFALATWLKRGGRVRPAPPRHQIWHRS